MQSDSTRLSRNALELATISAMEPSIAVLLEGWMLVHDGEVVLRAKSAVPLEHARRSPDVVQAIVDWYGQLGARPLLRLPLTAEFSAVCTQLTTLGLSPHTRTQVCVARSNRLANAAPLGELLTSHAPTPHWTSVYSDDMADDAELPSRLRVLGRHTADCLFLTVLENGSGVAAAKVSFTDSLCSVHGMRTARSARRRGFGKAMLGHVGRLAAARGIAEVFLQVEEANAAARALYAQGGFEDMYAYEYWER